jgi:hypothetical protein
MCYELILDCLPYDFFLIDLCRCSLNTSDFRGHYRGSGFRWLLEQTSKVPDPGRAASMEGFYRELPGPSSARLRLPPVYIHYLNNVSQVQLFLRWEELERREKNNRGSINLEQGLHSLGKFEDHCIWNIRWKDDCYVARGKLYYAPFLCLLCQLQN